MFDYIALGLNEGRYTLLHYGRLLTDCGLVAPCRQAWLHNGLIFRWPTFDSLY